MKYCQLLLIIFSFSSLSAQHLEVSAAKFKTSDDKTFADPAFDDSKWETLKTNVIWESQGYSEYNGYAWYRLHIMIPSSIKSSAVWKDSLRFYLAKIDDVDETYLNGKLIGKSGSFPEDKDSYQTAWNKTREYRLSSNDPLIHWDADNVIAVRVYDGGGGGGIFGSMPYVSMVDLIDGISIKKQDIALKRSSKKNQEITAFTKSEISNSLNIPVTGTLTLTLTDAEDNSSKELQHYEITMGPLSTKPLQISVPCKEGLQLIYSFTEKQSGKKTGNTLYLPYLLTPASPETPRINGAKTAGVRPGSPFLFKIPATGAKPLQYSVENLPAGLVLDEKSGIITGTISKNGDYPMTFVVKNKKGEDRRSFLLKCGDLLALTPPMGWNSWNCWGLSVSTEKVKTSANAMIKKGLIDHGWTYMNIDDGWEAEKRNPDGSISPNNKFPDMKLLGDFLHSNGLRFGIYSSPGDRTCGNYLGSYQHEAADAATYNSWGIDYLKYDWCSYEEVYRKENDTTLAAFKKPYLVMRDALQKQPRDIVYSLCQYGMKNVWEWGATVNGNCWRTTGDIEDTWESLSGIAFNQTKQYPYAKPGRWNDPDMLIVGQVGWGPSLHPTRLTADEQYTHISLWSMLSSPLLLGCDLDKLDDFTLNLLTNDEVIAIDQDPLGKQAQQAMRTAGYQVWIKDLEDGTKALAIFNTSDKYDVIRFHWTDLGLKDTQFVRDLWRQKDLGNFSSMFATKVPPHGVTLIKIK